MLLMAIADYRFRIDLAGGLVLVAGLAGLVWAAALGMQYGLDLHPCKLCLYQRGPWAVILVLGLASIWLRRYPRGLIVCGGLVTLALAVGAVIAGYHHGVEQHWWKAAVECSTGLPAAHDLASFKAALLNRPVVACDKVPWSFAGISMAGYNFILSLLAAAGLAGLVVEAIKPVDRLPGAVAATATDTRSGAPDLAP